MVTDQRVLLRLVVSRVYGMAGELSRRRSRSRA